MNAIGAILAAALVITAGGVWEALRASRLDSRTTPAGQGRKPARKGDGAQAHDAGVMPTFEELQPARFRPRPWRP